MGGGLAAAAAASAGCGGTGTTIGMTLDASFDDAQTDACCSVPPEADSGQGADATIAPDAGVLDAGSDSDALADAPSPVRECIPGASVACVGTGGCVTNQVCLADGSGFGPCVCAAPGEAGVLACVPGESIVCGGPGGCVSNQICLSDGSGYGPCSCPDAGSAPSDAAAAWTPSMLPGLVLWLNDSSGIVINPSYPGIVEHWLDSSGNGNLATNDVGAQGNGGSALDPSVINGHDAIFCTGADTGAFLAIQAAPSLDWGTGDFGIVIVAKLEQTTTIFSSSEVQISSDGSTHVMLNAGGQSVTVTNPNPAAFQIIAARGATLRLEVGGATASGTATTVDSGSSNVSLCSTSTSSIPGEIAEVIAVKGTLSDEDLATTQAYLSTKFGL